MKTKPNILVIVSDHHHWRMAGYLGHPHVRTPALDALAAGGAVFTNAYCNSPVCGPARSCYMSGKYNFEIGHWANGVPVPADLRTWAQRLAEAGVVSTLLGKIDFPGKLEGAGFADYRLSCRRGGLITTDGRDLTADKAAYGYE
ncbi:MAG: sulfatase-like hydrolase/transferase [Planctomycetaceae bacterium]|nr:sulfatase-like hydrolase/transferase [Planctomycetaceae bacterium]